MVWDEDRYHARMRNEDRAHNEGRHWLHFNVNSDTLTVRFNVQVVAESEVEFPPEIVNCATAFDGVMQHELCVSTMLILDHEGPPSSKSESAIRPQ